MRKQNLAAAGRLQTGVEPIQEAHVAEPGLLVIDVAGEATVMAIQDAVARTGGGDGPPYDAGPGQPGVRIRTGKGRCPHPVTLIVDSQSVKGASTVGRDSRGYDAAKKINGRKRHITVDTLGLPVMITVTPADIQDRDAARDVFWRLRLTQPQITQVWADRGYAGELVDWARERLWLTLRIVSRPKGVKGFVVLPRRWKVERTIGWCMNARRNARDYERLPQHSEAHLNWALITMMTRRLTRKSPRTDNWTKKHRPVG
ncbi:transposase IS4 family protein [Actinobacteria bacterium OK006]|nr:transposase IS4 family protein [Actinobacteria bacterium OK006]